MASRRVLLLDEVTSGVSSILKIIQFIYILTTYVTTQLDSTSAREVMSAIRTLAVAEGLIVLATIHQPSLETLAQFTNLLLLAEGRTCYSGPVSGLEEFFERWGRPVGRFVSSSVDCVLHALIRTRIHLLNMR
jgi:hypothetical protein